MKIAKWFKRTGTILFILILILVLPIGIPSLMGYQMYAIQTESMEPTYEVGTLLYVKSTSPQDVEAGDVITYRLGSDTDRVITHRVVEVNEEDATFITQGDANDLADPEPVKAERVIGRPVCSVKNAGFLAQVLGTVTGKIIVVCSLLLVFVLWIMADWMEKRISTTEAKTTLNKSKKLQVLGAALIVIALVGMLSGLVEYKREDNDYDFLAEKYTKEQEPSETEWKPTLQVELELLKGEYEDVVGWIYVENEDISYPILQGEDNEEYLHKNFKGEEANSGSIFIDSYNAPDFSDSHTIIYGHNMRDLSMFSRLRYYRTKEDYYDEHKYFVVITEEAAYRYEIFAYEEVSKTGFIYQVPMAANNEFEMFIKEIRSNSLRDSDVEVDKKDQIVTLSTCTTSDNKRFVVCGVLIDEYFGEND